MTDDDQTNNHYVNCSSKSEMKVNNAFTSTDKIQTAPGHGLFFLEEISNIKK